MEKGTYRIRPPRSRAPSKLRDTHASHATSFTASTLSSPNSDASLLEKYIFAVVLLLMFGVIFCFAAAYYLFSTR